MRIWMGGVAREADGSLALRPHPVTGHLCPVLSFDVVVTLNGGYCECRYADEDAGVAIVRDHGVDFIEHEPWRAVLGTVKIKPRFTGECFCEVCVRRQNYAP